MSSAGLGVDAGTLVALAALMILLMVTLIGGLGYIVVLRPKLRLRRRMAEFGLVGSAGGGAARSTVNPRQRRIQEKLQELEEKGNKKKRRNEIRVELLQAGLDINVQKYFLFTGLAGLGLALLAVLFQFGLFVGFLMALVGAFGLPKFVIRRIAKSRQKKFTQNFSNALDIMVRGVKSGLPVGECLAIMGREAPDPVGESFRLLVEGQKIGIALEDLLDRGLERMPTPEFKFFAIVLLIQQQTGGNLAGTLDGLSTVLRERKKMRDKVTSLSSEAKSSAMIIGSLPFFVAGMISLINPEYITLLFTETAGNVMLVGGFAWMGIGVLVMSKMINFEM